MIPSKSTVYQRALLSVAIFLSLTVVWRALDPGQGPVADPSWSLWRGWARDTFPGHYDFGLSPHEARVAQEKRLRVWDTQTSTCTANLSVMEKAWVRHVQAHIRQFLLYRHCRYFPILRNHPEKCAGKVYLLLAIKSGLPQHSQRETIRKTWGREREAGGGRGAIRTLFLLGTGPGREALDLDSQLLATEDSYHQDILQWDFLDSFFNLTLKEVNFLKWLDTFCPQVSFIFKGDDDVFVSPTNLLEFLQDRRPQENLLVGEVLDDARPIRAKRNKYYVPSALYSKTFYPSYAAGGGYLMTRRLAHDLYLASQTLELYPIDDVFQGMCLKVLRVRPMHHEGFKSFGITRFRESHLNKDPCLFRSMLMVHKMQPKEMLSMWDLVHRHLNCSHSFRFSNTEAVEEKKPKGIM
ncbi:UDP-GlcNAc:betaGal beta-1,3-N-acetylglucosaminyltransferase 7-like, partial [Gracilinanus agilis]|uniref:UDP-GlcNAc:betaGal beta-1,3-N-acetylglucosaminyltransferase 7-like n=1 Tax=Gracilinanus agilis TaxID=191870 RepID=UPI001CFEBFBE